MICFWLRPRCASALKHCNLQYKIDLTPQNVSEMDPFFICIDFYKRKSTFSFESASCIYQDFERQPQKCFSAITCAIWLRLIFRGRGSAWFFGAQLLYFWPRGPLPGPRIQFLARDPRSGSRLGLGDVLAKSGTPKNMVLFRNGHPNPEYGESRDPNGLYEVLEVFGRGGFPPKALRT